ncbi:MAG: hypothetical protein Hens2KO_16420 [Henriciella sp.]
MLKNLVLDRDSDLRASANGLFLACLAVSAALIILHLLGYSAVDALRDASQSTGREAGVLSNTGILLMISAAVISIFGAFVRSWVPLGVLGLFCLLFSMDDALMIHELFGAWEFVFFILYAGLMMLVMFLYWQKNARLPYPLSLCIGAFAASIVVDLLWGRGVARLPLLPEQTESFMQVGYILEDLPKLVGIILLFSFTIGESGLLSSKRR